METTTEPAGQPVVQFKRRGAKGKANIRKRAATPPEASDSDYSSSEDETGQRVKRRKKNTGAITASSKGGGPADRDLSTTVFTADRSVSLAASNDATSQSRLYSEEDSAGPTKKRDGLADGTYKGLANQTTFIQRNPDAPNRTVGPIKAPTNIRTVTFTDFAPDVCKDVCILDIPPQTKPRTDSLLQYKQTGFCGLYVSPCDMVRSRLTRI